MSNKINGGCLCGKVTYEIKDKFEKFYLCHCEQCRKITGSSFAANLFGEINDFKILTGEEFIKRFDYVDRDFTKAFCTECGSGVPYLNKSGTVIVVPAGSLNSEPTFTEQSKIFYNERANWCQISENAKVFGQFPT